MTDAGRWLDALALGLTGVALSLALAAVVVVPQRLAQRPAAEGVLQLRLGRDGALRLWHQPLTLRELDDLLARVAARGPRTPASMPPLRLLPDPWVPWGAVQQLLTRLDASGVPIELQLP